MKNARPSTKLVRRQLSSVTTKSPLNKFVNFSLEFVWSFSSRQAMILPVSKLQRRVWRLGVVSSSASAVFPPDHIALLFFVGEKNKADDYINNWLQLSGISHLGHVAKLNSTFHAIRLVPQSRDIKCVHLLAAFGGKKRHAKPISSENRITIWELVLNLCCILKQSSTSLSVNSRYLPRWSGSVNITRYIHLHFDE